MFRNRLYKIRVSGRVIHGSNPGPKPYLSHVEENELAEFLVDTAKARLGMVKVGNRSKRL